ncbi:hypothetical protein EON65_49940 [archaeon]|nr:MAG: hypothetical protein EON65_49940 [archaeon]
MNTEDNEEDLPCICVICNTVEKGKWGWLDEFEFWCEDGDCDCQKAICNSCYSKCTESQLNSIIGFNSGYFKRCMACEVKDRIRNNKPLPVADSQMQLITAPAVMLGKTQLLNLSLSYIDKVNPK